jgi:hypothetical protein
LPNASIAAGEKGRGARESATWRGATARSCQQTGGDRGESDEVPADRPAWRNVFDALAGALSRLRSDRSTAVARRERPPKVWQRRRRIALFEPQIAEMLVDCGTRRLAALAACVNAVSANRICP